MSFESFDTLLTTVWHSLDDILVCIGVFIIVHVFSSYSSWCLRTYFHCSHYISQAVQFIILFFILIFLVGHLIGSGTATSLFSGFSIGLGYAMQPYIVSLLAGVTFRSTHMFKHGDNIRIQGQNYILEHIGLIYVCALDGDNYKVYFPNSMLSGTPVGVIESKNK
jgi:small-conductance mechanosensitive channel